MLSILGFHLLKYRKGAAGKELKGLTDVFYGWEMV